MNVKNISWIRPIPTRDGQFTARYSEKGLGELNFPPVGRASPRAAEQNGVPAKIRAWHRTTSAALKNILAGRKSKNLPPLDLAGTEFQKSVWNALRKISSGKTKSYGEIARAIGRPKAVRAVGGACVANPVPVLVPCHRVLAANKKLGGFSGGLDWKRSLLAREGIKFERPNHARLKIESQLKSDG
jgi:O-6-methylguanine DNA methyltransferase